MTFFQYKYLVGRLFRIYRPRNALYDLNCTIFGFLFYICSQIFLKSEKKIITILYIVILAVATVIIRIDRH